MKSSWAFGKTDFARDVCFPETKGVNEISNVSIPDVYEPVKVIYETDNTRVLLVRHRHLGELRIVKTVIRTNTSGYEAEILKGLRHPSIPILYDYQEDDNAVCLIEEYVRGMSLKDYLSEHEVVSVDFILRCMVQICDVMTYLHERKPYPILYLDLKPEHVILRGEELMLVDYGAALYQPRSGITFQKYGTIRYMAPEVAEGTASVKCDLYSVGRIAEEMLCHTKERVSHRLGHLVASCTDKRPNRRPESARTLRDAFAGIADERAKKADGNAHFLKRIAVTGNESGIGTSHIAMALTVGLNALGVPAYYLNRSGKPVAHYLLRNEPAAREEKGIIYHKAFRGICDFGEAVEECTRPEEGVYVTDYGTDLTGAAKADRHIHVVGTRIWQNREVDEMAENADILLLNPDNRFCGRNLAILSDTPVMGFPMDKTPFYLSRRKLHLVRTIMEGIGIRR